MARFIKSHPVWSFLILFLVTIAGLIAYAASIEDFEVRWTRSVPSKESMDTLGKALEDFTVWPVFHHSLKDANTLDASGKDLKPEESKLAKGALLRYRIEPPKKEWKRFEILGQILDHVPGRRLEVGFESDSTGKITRLFDRFAWSVEIQEANELQKNKGFQSQIRGEARAHTMNWRGRVFGLYTPRILMNQVYYLDLVKFGTLTRQIEARKENLAPSYQ